ncbi:hypothetical protein [Streptomyces sp. NPDC048489]
MDTISKQYQHDQHDQDDSGRPYAAGRAQYGTGSTQYQDGYDGGGAPWES